MNGQALLSVVDHEARELHDVPGKMLPVLPICILLFITVKQVSVVNHRKSPSVKQQELDEILTFVASRESKNDKCEIRECEPGLAQQRDAKPNAKPVD